jgi:hypothetical protein
MKEPFDMVDEHIDTFIQTGRRGWELGCFIFNGDPIYDIEGTSQIKDIESISSEYFFLQLDGPYMCHPDDDMVT